MGFLGKILKSRGNKGEVICQTSPEIDVSKVDLTGQFELRSRKHSKKAKIESFSENGSVLIIKFDISNSINDSLRLVGYDVFFESLEIEPVYPVLKDFSVFDLDGEFWGTVYSVNYSAINKTIDVDDGENIRIIPFNDSIIVKIDADKKKITIDPPEGLKDLNIK